LIWQRTLSFVQKAGTLILVVSAIVWALSYFPQGETDTSYLARFGRFLEPVGTLMGMTWQMNVALLSSFVAKENAIATLGVLYGTGEEGLSDAMHALGPAAGLGFLMVQMLFVPCIATVGAIKQESHSWSWTLLNLLYLLVISLGSGVAAYSIGKLVW